MTSSITVKEADNIILQNAVDFGVEDVSFLNSVGRILAVDIVADRDMPPYDRVTMDGIAIRYQAYEDGLRRFKIVGVMAAGDEPVIAQDIDQCIEVMTGCTLPTGLDTIVRYEDVTIEGSQATINTDQVKKGSNVHYRGADKKEHEVVVGKFQVIDEVVVSVAASVGLVDIKVKKLPRIVVISTGDELVDVHQTPTPYQIRRSNNYSIKSTLRRFGIEADMLHLDDDIDSIHTGLMSCADAYDVIILSGGVSMGKFDYIPKALINAGVNRLFHKVLQKPGKPFWFGHDSTRKLTAFAFPGNPVSAFLCLYRYFIPWLFKSLSITDTVYCQAVLEQDVQFLPQLQYFLQVVVRINSTGQLIARPVEGNGSGDFSNLTVSNAFMELPAEKNYFKKGEVYKIIPFKTILSHG